MTYRLTGERAEVQSLVLDIAYEKAQSMLVEHGRMASLESLAANHRQSLLDSYNGMLGRESSLNMTDRYRHNELARYAEVLEAILSDPSYLHQAFEGNLTIRRLSEYDDVKGGDVAIEFSRKSGSILIGDITYGSRVVINKLADIKERLLDGRLSVIRYYCGDALESGVGSVYGVPKVIIGVDFKTLNYLMRLWIDNDYEKMLEHDASKIIISEIHLQLRSFISFIHKHFVKGVDQATNQRNLMSFLDRLDSYTVYLRNLVGVQRGKCRDQVYLSLEEGLKIFESL